MYGHCRRCCNVIRVCVLQAKEYGASIILIDCVCVCARVCVCACVCACVCVSQIPTSFYLIWLLAGVQEEMPSMDGTKLILNVMGLSFINAY